MPPNSTHTPSSIDELNRSKIDSRRPDFLILSKEMLAIVLRLHRRQSGVIAPVSGPNAMAIAASSGSRSKAPLRAEIILICPAGPTLHRFGLILAAKDCATIFPFRTKKVSVANSYELSGVSAVQIIYA